MTSDSIVEEYSQVFGSTKLNRYDIVFLDHAANDFFEVKNGDGYRLNDMHYGLHLLFQSIIDLSQEDEWPSIILLESYPSTTLANSYSNVYRRVAMEYNIPIWSYLDIVRETIASGSYPTVTKKLLMFEDYFLSDADKLFHPPWYIHLFIADIYANILRKEFSYCAVGGGLSNYTRFENMNLKYYVDRYNSGGHAARNRCRSYLLDVSASSLATGMLIIALKSFLKGSTDPVDWFDCVLNIFDPSSPPLAWI